MYIILFIIYFVLFWNHVLSVKSSVVKSCMLWAKVDFKMFAYYFWYWRLKILKILKFEELVWNCQSFVLNLATKRNEYEKNANESNIFSENWQPMDSKTMTYWRYLIQFTIYINKGINYVTCLYAKHDDA